MKITATNARAALCLAALCALPAGAQSSSPKPVQAVRAADFLDSLGVVSHDNYTDGKYADVPGTITDLHYLGVHQLRDPIPNPDGGIPFSNFLDALAALQKDGNSFDFTADCTQGAQPIAVQMQQLDKLESAKPGSILAVEGSNEVNNAPCNYKGVADPGGFTSNTAADMFQADLYAAVKADGNLAGVPVYFYTGNLPKSFRPNSDIANAHPYPNQGEEPGARISGEFANNFTDKAGYPRVITEVGYFSAPSNLSSSGVDEATQAKGVLSIYLDAYSQGIAKTFVYQLRSAYPDPDQTNSDTEYGLFNLDNTPKLAATAIHNLTSALSDTGSTATSFSPASLGYAVSGMPSAGHSLLMQKSNGSFVLALWSEPGLWDPNKHTEAPVQPQTLAVQFSSPVQTATLIDPYQAGGVLQTSTNTSTVTISITDHPVLLTINDASTGAPTPVPPPTPAPPTGGISTTAWYEIVNQHSNLCVDDFNWNVTDGNILGQWACGSGQANQEWQFKPTDSGYYSIISRNAPGSVVDVEYESTASGAKIHFWQNFNLANQQWKPVSVGGGYYNLVGRGSNKCLDVPGASQADGVQFQIYDCNNTWAQAFKLVAQP